MRNKFAVTLYLFFQVLSSVYVFSDIARSSSDPVVNERTYQYLCKNIDEFETMSELERVNAIRRWLGVKLNFLYYNYKKEDGVLQNHQDYLKMESVDIIEGLITNRNLSYMFCGGMNTILRKVYEELNIPVVTLNMGFCNTDYTHFVTLVEVGSKLFLQDAWINTTWVSKDGKYLSLDEVLGYLENDEALKVYSSPEFRVDFNEFIRGLEDALAARMLPSNHNYILYFVFEINSVNKRMGDYANGDLLKLVKINRLDNMKIFNSMPIREKVLTLKTP